LSGKCANALSKIGGVELGRKGISNFSASSLLLYMIELSGEIRR
jgi:hypothetical protein